MPDQPCLDLGIPDEPAKPKRKTDPVFDAIASECGLDLTQLTRSARGALNRALADIRSARPHVNATDIKRAVAMYRAKYPTWPLTYTSLAKHWPSLWSSSAAEKLPPNVREMLQRQREAAK